MFDKNVDSCINALVDKNYLYSQIMVPLIIDQANESMALDTEGDCKLAEAALMIQELSSL